MAAPNLLALTSGKIDTAIQLATTSLVDVTWPIAAAAAVPTGHAYNVDAIYCANKHASIAAKITILFKKSSTEYELVPLQRVSPGQMINVLLGKPLYMAEGDKLRIICDTASAIHIFAPYTDVN